MRTAAAWTCTHNYFVATPEAVSDLCPLTYELDSSHVPMLSQPERVIEVIRAAANAVHKGKAAA
jgi:hypothetical protein